MLLMKVIFKVRFGILKIRLKQGSAQKKIWSEPGTQRNPLEPTFLKLEGSWVPLMPTPGLKTEFELIIL